MQWWVEVTALDGDGSGAEFAIEASSWQGALAEVRQSRGEGGTVSLEVLDPGFRAFDLAAGRRYLVLPGPSAEFLPPWLLCEGLDDAPRSYELVVSRDHEPTPELPLVYRERGVRVASGVSQEAAANLLRHLLDEQRRSLKGYPQGKLVELAVFVGVFDRGALPAPLATLNYRDWRREAEIGFPGSGSPPQRFAVSRD